MLDKYIYNFLMFVNHWSTKLTSWSWCMLYSDNIVEEIIKERLGHGNRRRQKDSQDTKKDKSET